MLQRHLWMAPYATLDPCWRASGPIPGPISTLSTDTMNMRGGVSNNVTINAFWRPVVRVWRFYLYLTGVSYNHLIFSFYALLLEQQKMLYFSKTSKVALTILILYLSMNLFNEKQRNNELYDSVMDVHEEVRTMTSSRQICTKRSDVVDLPFYQKVKHYQ